MRYLPTRPQDTFEITDEQIRELREEIFPYWRGQTLEETVAERVPVDVRHAVDGKAFSLNQTDHAQGHILPDVEGWLRLGIDGLRANVNAKHASVPVSRRRRSRSFYEASTDRPRSRVGSSWSATPTWPRNWLRRVTIAPDGSRSCSAIAERCRWLSAATGARFPGGAAGGLVPLYLAADRIERQQFLAGPFRPVHAALSATRPGLWRVDAGPSPGTARTPVAQVQRDCPPAQQQQRPLLCRLSHRLQHRHRRAVARRQRRHQPALATCVCAPRPTWA